jgi:hypothetical protein
MWKWMKRLFGKHGDGKKNKPMSHQRLTDLTRGIHHAASTTQAMLAEQFIRMFDQFFDHLDDGTLRAKMVKVEHPNAEGVFLLVPLISLVAPKGIVMNKMEVEMSVRIEETTTKPATDFSDNSGATRTSFKVSFAPKSKTEGRRSDLTTIKMTFEAGDPPEGVMRVIEEFTNGIHPINKDQINGQNITAIGERAQETRKDRKTEVLERGGAEVKDSGEIVLDPDPHPKEEDDGK